MDRQTLRNNIRFNWTFYRAGEWIICCSVCHSRVDGFDIHEALVKRSQVNPEDQHLIFVPENCVPVCRDCHERGQTQQVAEHLLGELIANIGARQIGEWYLGLVDDHGLSLPRGTPPPGQDETAWSRYLLDIFAQST